jgi:hypothetical protein
VGKEVISKGSELLEAEETKNREEIEKDKKSEDKKEKKNKKQLQKNKTEGENFFL